MPLPITIPNTFANATATIPLSQLDNNFATVAVAVNSIGNGAFTLANVQVTGGTIANVTLNNVSIDLETLSNVTITNLTVDGNATFTNAAVTANVATITTANTTDVTASNSAVISVNTSGNALRITQTGAGNALLVEDSTNPDSTPFLIDASGQVITGNTTAVAFTYASAPRIEVIGTSQSTSSIAATTFNGTAGVASAMLLGRGRGTAAAPTIVSSGDDIGLIQFESHDGTALIPAASILAEVDGTPGTNDMPGRLVFSTTADGASSPTERMRITSAGAINMASTSSLQKGGTAAYTLKEITYLTSGTGATYTTPAGVRALYVECVGGGGGGGGVDGQGAGTGVGGGGGGGGGYVAKLITSPSASYTYTVGAGGAGGAAGANNGALGGDTTFTDGTLLLTAEGGGIGSGLTAAASNAYYQQSVGGGGSGGDVVIGGLRGGARSRGNFAQFYGGYGGGSIFGVANGGAGGTNAAGTAGTQYGAGGGGGGVEGATTNYAGGAGYQGVIRITEYY